MLLKPYFKYGNASFVPQLFFQLIRGNFDIVHLHYPFFGGMEAVWLAKKMFKNKFKLVVHYHMNVVGLPWYLEILRLPSRLINKSLFRLADSVTCASSDYIKSNDADNIYGDYKGKFSEIPFGVDVSKFTPGKIKKNQILYVGGIDKAHYFKGVGILIEAFSQLKSNNYKLILVGNGDLIPEYKILVNKLCLENQVIFGEDYNNDKLIETYQESSVLVLPSINACEAFGKVLLEAMACGTPVIASALPGVRTVFEDKVQGFYVVPSDTDDLVEKLNQIINLGDQRKQMGDNARKLAESKYDNTKINKTLLDLYQNLL